MKSLQKRVLEEIEKKNIQFVRFMWCDNAGIIRAKAVHVKYLTDYLAGTGVGIAMAQQALPVMYDAPSKNSGLTPAGEVFMRADWSTFKVIPYSPGNARVFTNIFNGTESWSHCPRSFLQKVIIKAQRAGLSFMAAFENEFYLLNRIEGKLIPFDESLFAQTSALDKANSVISAITESLEQQEIYPEMVYPESGGGQFEIPVHFANTLVAADQQVVFRETVRGVVQKNENLAVSFVPKIFADKAGNGAHLHLSIWRNSENITISKTNDHEISEEAEHFIAGILFHLPALMCLTTPSTNSFKRIQPQYWSGAYTCWGYGNREAAVRIPQADKGSPITNLELKTVDPSCNPYLALGSVITAGLDGLEKKMKLSNPIDKDPSDLTEKEMKINKIKRLPINLREAIGYLRGDNVLQNALGKDLSQSFLAVRTAEWEAMKDLTIEQERALLLERY